MENPTQLFNIDSWFEGEAQDFSARRRKRYLGLDDPRTWPRPFFNWLKLNDSKPEGVEHIGRRFVDLFCTQVDLSPAADWRFDRPLGLGSFGAAALFSVSDGSGSAVDEIVIKTAEYNQKLMATKGEPELSREAAIMAMCNKLDTPALLRLRDFKCYLADDDKPTDWRYFLENGEHGDLDRLRLRYKAWQLWFPEYFLWHLFYWLVDGLEQLETGKFRQLDEKHFGEETAGHYIIHKDIKPQNIFLGQTPVNGPNDYPAPKMADFGLARLCEPGSKTSGCRYNTAGTALWLPPEVQYREQGEKTTNYFFRDKSTPPFHKKDVHRIKPAANIWAVAAIMYTFVTSNDIEVLHWRIKYILSSDRPLYGDHIILPIVTGRNPEYSEELLNLIRDCLKIVPESRPDITELKTRVKHGMHCSAGREKALHKADPGGTTGRLKVYLSKNEINDVPHGDAGFILDSHFWERFVAHLIWLPTEWGTLYPSNMPPEIQIPKMWPSAFKERLLNNDFKGDKLKRAREEEDPQRRKRIRTGTELTDRVVRMRSHSRWHGGNNQVERRMPPTAQRRPSLLFPGTQIGNDDAPIGGK